MIQVRCESCQATFELDERRIPKNGMRVRCPRCSASFHVAPDGSVSATTSAAAPKAGGARDLSLDDLPAPSTGGAKGLSDLPTPAANAPKGLSDLPTPAVNSQ